MSTPEQRVAELGLEIPDYTDPPYGGRYGSGLKAFHRTGDLVELSGITPEDRAGNRLHPGVIGADISVVEAREAAVLTATQALGLIRLAVGSLDNVAGALPRAVLPADDSGVRPTARSRRRCHRAVPRRLRARDWIGRPRIGLGHEPLPPQLLRTVAELRSRRHLNREPAHFPSSCATRAQGGAR